MTIKPSHLCVTVCLCVCAYACTVHVGAYVSLPLSILFRGRNGEVGVRGEGLKGMAGRAGGREREHNWLTHLFFTHSRQKTEPSPSPHTDQTWTRQFTTFFHQIRSMARLPIRLVMDRSHMTSRQVLKIQKRGSPALSTDMATKGRKVMRQRDDATSAQLAEKLM